MDAPENLPELVSEFAGITGASPLVADHYLSACNYDLNRAVEFYFEHPPAPSQGGARASNSVPDEEAAALGAFGEDADLAGGPYAQGAAGSARREVADDDEELQRALAESMAEAGVGLRRGSPAAGPGRQPMARHDEDVHVVEDDEEMPGADELLAAMARQREVARAADREARARMEEMMDRMMGGLQRGPGVAGMPPAGIDPLSGLPTMFPSFGNVPPILPPGHPRFPIAGPAGRSGRGRDEGGGGRGAEFGTRARDGSGGGASGAGQAQRRRIEVGQGGLGGAAGTATARAEGAWDDDELELPEGMSRQDLEEARMMEAALLGVPYEGRLRDFTRAAGTGGEELREVAPEVLEHRELRWDQDRAYEESLAADRAKEEAAARAKAETEARERAQREAEADAERAAAEESARLDALVASKVARLPAEPPSSATDAINVMVRLPDGTRHSRRFARTDRLSSLFDFVDVELDSVAKAAGASAAAGGGDGVAAQQPSLKPGSYNLVTQFPRNVFSEEESGGKTFEEAGLTGGGGAAFFVQQKGG